MDKYYSMMPRFYDDNGDPLNNGKIYTYEAGTSTPKTTYQDRALSTAHANPIRTNSRGEPDAGDGIFFSGTLKIVIKDANDVQVGEDQDNLRALDQTQIIDADSDTYITVGSGNQILFYSAGVLRATLDATGLLMAVAIVLATGLAIQDTDGDTKIQVEEGADDDTIRFDCAGTEQVTIQDGKIEPTTDNDIDLGAAAKAFKDAFLEGILYADTIAEINSAAGVTIDGVLLKDGKIGANTVDSNAYVDDSIDAAHYAPGSVDQTAIGANAVGTSELRTGTNTATLTNTPSLTLVSFSVNSTVTHLPRTYVDSGTSQGAVGLPGDTSVTFNNTAATLQLHMYATSGDTTTASALYHTASSPYGWIFMTRDKVTKQRKRTTFANDHPCFSEGRGAGDPKRRPHPFTPQMFDPATEEIITIVLQPDELARLEKEKMKYDQECVLHTIFQDYDIDETQELDWPSEPISVGWEHDSALPGKKVREHKATIKKPANIKCFGIKKKP